MMKKLTLCFITTLLTVISLIFLSPSYLFALPSKFTDNGHYYEVIVTPEPGGKLWTEAKVAAENLTYNDGSNTYGGHLVTITDADEQAFVSALLTGLNYACWIGAYQDTQDSNFSEPSGGWKWITGESWSYTNWYPDNPNDGYDSNEPNNNNGNEDYALINFPNSPAQWGDGRWVDLGNVKFFTSGYIVEYDILLQPPVVNSTFRALTPEEIVALNLNIIQQVDRYGATNNGFVEMLYDNALGRAYDSSGYNYWVEQLAINSMTGSQIAYHFIFSNELSPTINSLSDNDFISFLYQTLMNRPYDNEGYADWQLQMELGMTREELVNHFVNSPEFAGICTLFNVTP